MNAGLARAETKGVYHVEFEERPDYLLALFRGNTPGIEAVLDIWREVAEQCHQRGYDKVLVDEDWKGQITFSKINQFAEQLPKIGFIGIKLAFLDRQIDQHLMNQFGENVAVNRGVNGKVFCDYSKAEAWLLS